MRAGISQKEHKKYSRSRAGNIAKRNNNKTVIVSHAWRDGPLRKRLS